MAKIQKSVEPNIADLVNGWLKTYNLPYKLEQESLNIEIDNALNEYHSKNGGKGGIDQMQKIENKSYKIYFQL